MDEPYRTLSGRGRAAFEIRGSEFVGRVAPVATVDEAEAFVAEVEAEFADATHNVPAYRVRDESGRGDDYLLREWSSDDGEPSGSAGKPMLNVLQGNELENVVAVVTRYYGGTNLGVGGLVRAYSRAVKEAVAAAEIVERRPRERVEIRVEYDDSGTVRSVLESAGVAFDATYEETVTFVADVPREDAEALRDRVRSATSGRAAIE